ncbi:MAG: ComEA family DNA-binding protein, partial [Cytophagales bacterium]
MKWWLFGCVLILFEESIAQDNPRKEFDPASLVDEIFAMQDLNISYQDLYENYLQLLSNPYDLNKVTEEQLQSLYVLNMSQIRALLRYRKEAGPFVSIYELQNVPNFSIELIQKISPFFMVVNPSASLNPTILHRISKNENNYFILRWARTLERQKGYLPETDSTSKYAGTPDQLYTRFRTSKPGDFSLGFTLEKDAGEALRWDAAKKYYALDYISYHAQVLNKGKIKNAMVGDYQAQFGQGIALGSVFGIGKNGEAVTTVRRSNLGFSPYTSLYEAGYFRGAAISYELSKKLLVHAMYSLRSRDANVNQDTTQNVLGVATSFSFTGLHRTPRELAGRNATREQNLAMVLNFKNSKVDAGILVHQTNFSTPLVRESTPYNQFFFNGNHNLNVGGFFNYHLQNISFFSEWTRTIG